MSQHNVIRFKRILAISTLFAVLLLASCNYPPLLEYRLQTTQTAQIALYRDAEYPVPEVFLSWFSSLSEDASFAGEPVSLPYTDPATGSTVQYFQKARLETVSDQGNATGVSITPLGKWFLDQASGTEVIIDQDCIQFPENPYQVCAAFRTHYESHRGSELFGAPVSNVYQTTDRFFQYFENACLIWDPAAPEGRQVSLANLGEMYLLSQEPYRESITQTEAIQPLTHIQHPQESLQVYIAFEEPFCPKDQIQQVYIQVIDASGQPVQSASVTVYAIYPDQSRQQYRPASTDQNGITSFPMMGFAARELKPNDIITIEAIVLTGQAEGSASDWFRIWE